MIEQNPDHPNGTCEACGGPCAVCGCRYCPACYDRVTLAGRPLELGDWIEADFTFPSQHTRAAQLNTPEALAYGAELLADPSSGWRRATREWVAQREEVPTP